MVIEIKSKDLHGKWIHSHEEDTADQMVFRPASYAFPPSRGRVSFELGADGHLQQTGIAPDDRRGITGGSWKLEEGNRLAFYTGAGEAKPRKILVIEGVGPDKMLVKK